MTLRRSADLVTKIDHSFDMAPASPLPERVPLAALLVMALMGFVLIATETMPAGLLAPIAAGLRVSEGTAGQLVTVYALGTIVMSIPAVTLTREMRRKPLFLSGILGFLLANTVSAISPNIALSLAARMVAGAFSGFLWGMLAGYARRITPARHAGRALAIASVGTPIGLAMGTPFGSWLGMTLSWRWSFGALSILTFVVLMLSAFLVPDASGQLPGSSLPIRRVFRLPGVGAILLVIFTWMVGHNIVYTYFASYLRSGHVNLSVDRALATFGVAALVGIWITGAIIDRWLRGLVLASLFLFVVAGTTLFVGHRSLVATLAGLVLWGVAFGGAAAQLQTAIGSASGENADVANSLLAGSFNLAIFTAGLTGAVLVDRFGGLVLPPAMIALAGIAFVLVLGASHAGFPVRTTTS